ncbi:hypothetical protein SPURM210S_01935 [Streptomyces purpurascens]
MASEQIGYRGPTACAAAGITYRQLDYWARTGLVEPSVRPAHRSGTQRLYSFRDVVVLKIVKRFLDTGGIAQEHPHGGPQHLRERGFRDLERMTLMSDGATVYECTSPDEVHALLQGHGADHVRGLRLHALRADGQALRAGGGGRGRAVPAHEPDHLSAGTAGHLSAGTERTTPSGHRGATKTTGGGAAVPSGKVTAFPHICPH